MCSGSEAGSYLRLIDFVYHSTLGLRVIKKKREVAGLGFRVSSVEDVLDCFLDLPVPPVLRISELGSRKVDVRLPGKGNSNSHGARPVHLIITMIKWIRTSRLSIKNSLPLGVRFSGFGFRVSKTSLIALLTSLCLPFSGFGVWGFEFEVSGYGVMDSGFGFRGFGIEFGGFGFRISGFGFRVSGFGFRFLGSGFGFQFSDFKLKGVRV